MKYQIYLKKTTSEVINAVAKAEGKKPATFIKEFLEQCFNFVEDTLGDENVEKVKRYGRTEQD